MNDVGNDPNRPKETTQMSLREIHPPSTSRVDELKKRTDDLICQAERQKAVIAKPPGKQNSVTNTPICNCDSMPMAGSRTEGNDDNFLLILITH